MMNREKLVSRIATISAVAVMAAISLAAAAAAGKGDAYLDSPVTEQGSGVTSGTTADADGTNSPHVDESDETEHESDSDDGDLDDIVEGGEIPQETLPETWDVTGAVGSLGELEFEAPAETSE